MMAAAEGLSSRCGGQGFAFFYGMAKPVHTPLIGRATQPDTQARLPL
jgi:hypothetical protein